MYIAVRSLVRRIGRHRGFLDTHDTRMRRFHAGAGRDRVSCFPTRARLTNRAFSFLRTGVTERPHGRQPSPARGCPAPASSWEGRWETQRQADRRRRAARRLDQEALPTERRHPGFPTGRPERSRAVHRDSTRCLRGRPTERGPGSADRPGRAAGLLAPSPATVRPQPSQNQPERWRHYRWAWQSGESCRHAPRHG